MTKAKVVNEFKKRSFNTSKFSKIQGFTITGNKDALKVDGK